MQTTNADLGGLGGGWILWVCMLAGCGSDPEGAGSDGPQTSGAATTAMGESTASASGSSAGEAGLETGGGTTESGMDTGSSSETSGDTGSDPVDLCAGLVVDDLENHPPSMLAPPALGGSVVDPEFGTTIVRVASGGVPMYSTISAWNADASRLILYHPGSGHQLYDGSTYEELGSLPIGPNDLELVYWDTNDPDVFYYPQGDALYAYAVSSGRESVVTTFEGCGGDDATAGGDPFFSSFDSARFGFKCGSTHLVYDRVANEILGLQDSGFDLGPQMAPSGQRAYWQGLVVAPDLSTNVDLMLDSPYEHASMGWDAQGSDAYLTVVFDGIDVGSLVAYDMQTGAANVVVGPATGYPYPPGGTHVSGLAYDNPGWAVLSVVGAGDGATLLDGEILVANWETGQVCRAAHHRSSGSDYFAEPHAVPSPDGTRILFGSDWAGTQDAYVVELPSYAP